MSRKEFFADWDKIDNERKKQNLPLLKYRKIWEIVRDNWIETGKINALIKFICDEFDSGQWDEFHEPLERHLISTGKIQQFKYFWNELLRIRINDYQYYKRESLKAIKRDKLQLTIHPDFKVTILEFQENIMDGFERLNRGLKDLNQIDEIEINEKKLRKLLSFENLGKISITDKRKINDEVFWDLIVECRKDKASNSKFIENIGNKLVEFDVTEIINFYRIFLEYYEKLNQWDIWAFAYIYRNGCGDDEFDYFRSWVISMGPDIYNKLLKLNISKKDLEFAEDPQLEDFLYLPVNIYEGITFEDMPKFKIKKQKLSGKKWDANKLQKLYPQLYKEFAT